jgi:hypothetical protein
MKAMQPLIRLSKCKTSNKKTKKGSPEIVKGGSEKKRVNKAASKAESLFEKLLKSNSSSKKEPTVLNSPPVAPKSLRSASKKVLKISPVPIPATVHAKHSEEKQISPKFGSQKNHLSTSTHVIGANVAKKCTCSKSKCLKLYCECFAHGMVCGLDCGCKDCCNNDESTDVIK